MKKYTIILMTLLLPALLFAQGRSRRPAQTRPERTKMGLALSVSQQDANQIGGYGLGPGIEFFIRKTTASPFLYSFGAGVITLNDDIFTMDKVRTFLMPSLNVKAGYYIFNRHNFSLNPYFGLHGFSAMSREKTETGTEYSERSFHGGALMGLSFTVLISYPTSLYLDMGVREVLFSSIHESMTFTMVEIGIVF